MAEAARKFEEQLENAPVSETAERKTPIERAAERGPEQVREEIDRIKSEAEQSIETATESVKAEVREDPDIAQTVEQSAADATDQVRRAALETKISAGVETPEEQEELLEKRTGVLETTIKMLESKGVRTPIEELKLEAAKAERDAAAKQIEIREHQQILQRIDDDLAALGKEWMELRKQAPANDIESFPPEIQPHVREVWGKMEKLERAKAGGMKELAAALAGVVILDRLRAQADENVRMLEIEIARKSRVAEAGPKPEEAEESATQARAERKPHAAKRIAKGTKTAGKWGLFGVGAIVGGGLLSVSKIFDWIDRGLAWLQKPRTLKEMLHTIFVKPAKWILTRPEKMLDWVNYKLSGKKPVEEKEKT